MSVTQAQFATALLDADAALPAGLTAHHTRRPERRFAVHRNNVVASLVEALRAKFPATDRIVGEEFFRAMARVFVTVHPPRSKILHIYGDDFGAFIEAFEPAAEMPYLGDVARLEAARTRAYHAADAMPLAAQDFARLDPASLGGLRLMLHPSLEILRSLHPVVTIWSMNAGEIEPGPIEDYGCEDALILRPQDSVTVRRLPAGGAVFLQSLRRGDALADAVDQALAADSRFDLTDNLAGLIGSGAVSAVATEGTQP